MSPTYRAMQIAKPGELELVEREFLVPHVDQVLIEVEACGICGADINDIDHPDVALEQPRVPGHEVIGRIIARGTDVPMHWRLGQRVGVGRLGGQCNECAQCRRGQFQLCQSQHFVGSTCDGGYAELMLARYTGLVAIPDELTSEEAAPILCAGLATFNALKKSGAEAGDTVAILGIGGLGHMAVQYARKMGFRVVAIGRGEAISKDVRHLGAHFYLDSNNKDTIATLKSIGGVQALVTTITNADEVSPYLNAIAPQGTMIVLGAGKSPLSVSTGNLVASEKEIKGSMTGSACDSEKALNFSALFEVLPRVETMPLYLANQALVKLRSGNVNFRIVLTMDKVTLRVRS